MTVFDLFSIFCSYVFDSVHYATGVMKNVPRPQKEDYLEVQKCALLCVICRLTGSFVPDLIVSMSHQMWLHLQSDESVGSIGFKINYKGTQMMEPATVFASFCLPLPPICLSSLPSPKMAFTPHLHYCR